MGAATLSSIGAGVVAMALFVDVATVLCFPELSSDGNCFRAVQRKCRVFIPSVVLTTSVILFRQSRQEFQ